MIIANPIYDVTFKRILENDRAAKFFVSTILGCKVLSFEPAIEQTEIDKETGSKVTLFCKDFAATVVTEEEGERRVIIEIQKAKTLGDVLLFSKYLKREYTKSGLPIITIFILGFNLSVDSPAFGNVPVYRDLRTNEQLHFRDMFVEKLTRSAYFIQTMRIKPSLNTRLDKLLSLFEQNNFIGEDHTTKDYALEIDDPDVKTVYDILFFAAADFKTRKELERELRYQEAMEESFGEKDRELAEVKKQWDEFNQRRDELKQQSEETEQL